MAYDVIVIGGGAIGLAVARELAVDHSVLLLERGTPGRQASWAAAGMLCPHGEASIDDPIFRLGLSSLSMYRSYVRGLRDETGVDAEYQDEGTLVLASTEQDWQALRRRFEWQHASGLDSSILTPEEVRYREPRLSLDILGALYCRSDHQVHPRRLLDALRKACEIRGVDIRSGFNADEVLEHDGRMNGVRCGARRYDAPRVVVAAGAWSQRIVGLTPLVEMRPRKGQILALDMPAPVIRHVVRWGQFYLTPRLHGKLIVGATDEDCGFDRDLTVAGLGQLLEAAARMSADVGAYRVAETWTGLRPATSDGLPAIGRAGIEGLFYALGHYRNGILLTPITAQIVGDAVRGLEADELRSDFSPMRFSSPELVSEAAVPESGPPAADV